MSPQGKPFVELYKKQLNDEVLRRTNEKAKALKGVKNSDLQEKDPTMYENVVKELSKPVTLSGMADAATSIMAHVGAVLGIGAAAVSGPISGPLIFGAGLFSQVIASAVGGGGSLEGPARAVLGAKTMGLFR